MRALALTLAAALTVGGLCETTLIKVRDEWGGGGGGQRGTRTLA